MATEEQHAAAVIAALNALGAVAFDYDDVPGTPPAWYTTVSVTRRFGGVQRAGGSRDGQLYRVAERSIAKTISNARNLRSKADALEGAVLSIGGLTTTPLEFESSQAIGTDDGWWSGLRLWTYALI